MAGASQHSTVYRMIDVCPWLVDVPYRQQAVTAYQLGSSNIYTNRNACNVRMSPGNMQARQLTQ
jgi:hypothetical protein